MCEHNMHLIALQFLVLDLLVLFKLKMQIAFGSLTRDPSLGCIVAVALRGVLAILGFELRALCLLMTLYQVSHSSSPLCSIILEIGSHFLPESSLDRNLILCLSL
jgi:hypothetical protein